MSITSRISSMEEHVTNAYNGLQGLGADLTGIDKNINNIASVLDDIYDDLPKVTGSGTSITLDDTRKGRVNMEFSGNTSQFTTTGKNLLENTLQSQTANGITFIKNDDGSLTFNGTATQAHSITGRFTNDLILRAGTSYIFSLGNKQAGYGVYLQQTGNVNVYYLGVSDTNSSLTFTPTEDVTIKQLAIHFPNGNTVNGTIYPMVRLSSVTDSTYEPYTGGQASPNPDFPQDIHVVSGDNTIKIEGKNIIDLTSLLYRTSSTSTSDRKANSFTQYGMGNWGNTAFYIKNSKKNTNYTISMKALSSLARRSGVSVYGGADTDVTTPYTNIGTQWLDINANTQGSTSYSFNSGDYEYLMIRFWNNGTATALSSNVALYISDVQLEYGSSFTGYEPYNVTSYPINLGVKNLWNSEDMKSGYLPQSGSYPTTDPSYPNSRYIIVPLMKGQSITTYSEVTYNAFRIRYIDKDTNLIVGTVSVGENSGYCNSNATYQSGFANGTITATKDVLLGLWDFDGYMSTSGYYKITYGTTLQQISPNPIELAEISTYNDEIFRTSGKNLLPNNATTQTINGVTFTINSGKSVTLNGTASAIADFYIYGSSTDTGEYIYIPKGTYSISEPSSGWFYIGREKTLGAVVGNSALLNALSLQDCYFYGFIIRATSGSSFSNLTLYPQIEKGSTATEYNPFGTGEWYYKEAIKKVVLNGMETISAFDATSLSGSYQATFGITARATTTDKVAISDKFISALLSDRTTKTNIIYSYSDGYLRIATNVANTMAGFKTWLGTNNPKVLLEAATLTYTKITSSNYPTLYSQLEDIYNAQGYDNQTNISQTNNDLPFKITASALKEWSV